MSDFGQVGERFIAYYDTVRGHIREVLVRENLRAHLPSLPAAALDVGGGDGRDSAWLAGQGFTVDFVDSSQLMVDRARRRFSQMKLPIKIHRLHQGQIQTKFARKKFDLVLSHGVLMYADEPDSHLRDLVSLTKSGGIVSLLTKGYEGALARALEEHNEASLAQLLAQQRGINNLGLEVWAFKPAQVRVMLARHGFRLLDWRGVRVASDQDRRPLQSLRAGELDNVLSIESYLGKMPSTKGMGQMIHYMAVKNGI